MRVKRNQKNQAGIHRSLPPTYLEEFVWRQDFVDAPLKNLILQIRSIYRVEGLSYIYIYIYIYMICIFFLIKLCCSLMPPIIVFYSFLVASVSNFSNSVAFPVLPIQHHQ